MHIHLLIPSLEYGGAQKVAVSLINEWAKEHKVTLVLFHDLVEYNIDERVEKVILGVKRSPLRLKTGVEVLRAAQKLHSYISTCDGKLLFYGIMESANLVLSIVKKLRPDRLFAIGGSHTNVVRYGSYTKLFGLYRHLDVLVTVSQYMRDWFIEMGLRESVVKFIPNPVNREEILEGASEQIPEDLNKLISQGKFILGAGRLVNVKNFELLIKAFKIVVGKRPDINLVILGEGELRVELEALVEKLGLENIVHMPGHRDNPYIWMKHAEVFVLSSDFEGWPNVLLEALTLGTSVVSTDCDSGPAEILEKGELGNLVPVGDDVAMAKAIDSAFEVEGVAVENSRWSIDNVAGKYLELADD